MRIERWVADICLNIARVVRAFCGLLDYEAYLAHWREHHRGTEPLDRPAFFREREAARYARGRSRCC